MRPRLPPLNALEVFEAAARHMSFRRAAEELNVTHSAVSHQVKALEEQFGVPLFERASRRVSLTEAGEVYYPILRDAFDRIARGAELVRTVESPNVLTVQVYVSMALRWLIPRLYRFEARHPDINVRLSTSYLQWEFDRGNVDVGIVIAAEREPGLHYTRLFRSEVFPVCAPRFVDGPQALHEPADLLGVLLLHVYTVPNDWRRWLQAAGIETGAGGKGTSFDSFVLALEAAIAGQGVALSNMMFVRDDLETGRLVKPFDIGVPQEGEWFLACVDGSEDQAKIAVFRDWLVAELKADPDVGG